MVVRADADVGADGIDGLCKVMIPLIASDFVIVSYRLCLNFKEGK
jgi:hypothetical protein